MIRILRPRSFHGHLSLPIFGPIIDAFTQWSHLHGYTFGTIRNQLKDIHHLITFFQQQGLISLNKLIPEDFDRAWHYFHKSHPSIAGTTRQLQKFLEQTHRLPQPSPIPQTRSNQLLVLFSDYLKQVRGFSGTTIRSHLRYMDRFLNSIGFEENEQALPSLDIKQIENFLRDCSKTLNRYSLQHLTGYLRTFLRFEYSKGVLSVPLHEMIDTPRIYRLEKLPRALAWTTVNDLLLSIDRTDVHGRRDYAMLYLIAAYGLRSCEVVSLILDDINWRSGTISIRQGKTDNELLLPLTNAVANALIDYVKNGRPHLPDREVFLRVRAPQGRLKPTAVAEAFQRQVRLSGLNIPYQGPHCLRHSYAVHLLRQGTSVKVIGDVLGHRNIESTCVYLRLAIDDLRGVALEVPSCQEENIPVDATALKDLPPAKSLKKAKTSMPLQSFLLEEITAYLNLHHSLGKSYRLEKEVLHSLDTFLVIQFPNAKELDGNIFNQWCQSFIHLTSTVRRNHMRIARNFCLYRQRFSAQSFIPDMMTFPANHAKFIAYIFSSTDMARILRAAMQLPVSTQSALRPEVIRLAIILLYTSGLRRGELLRLTLGDYHPDESTLLIRSTKFHKERVIPLSVTADFELRAYLDSRKRGGMPMNESAPVIWNKSTGTEGRAYTGNGLSHNFRILCASLKILTPKGIPPRIHDIRHSFAVNALLRWYHNNEDVLVKLPQLSTYMGHVSIVSTQCYLPFIEPLRSEASKRFEQNYGNLITGVIEESQPRISLDIKNRRVLMNKSKATSLAIALQSFFHNYLPQLKGVSHHTVHSYRDALKLLLLFLAHDKGSVDCLDFDDINVQKIIAFLDHLETKRGNGIGTRNIRLAAVHSFFRYVASSYPEYLHLSQQILSIPFKRMQTRTIEYLEYEELTAVIEGIDRSKPDGRRDYALLILMFNTGARVQEMLDLKANNLQLSAPFSVRLFGKGRKERICPIWTKTAHVLQEYVEEHNIDLNKPLTLFNNHLDTPLTRFGVRYILAKYIHKAASTHPSLKAKRLHPHSMRHSTAVHLLKSGVDLATIANWLGHASNNTTNRYAKIDLDMKREAIKKAEPPQDDCVSNSSWRKDPDLLQWLESL